jgi:hypothetical protein
MPQNRDVEKFLRTAAAVAAKTERKPTLIFFPAVLLQLELGFIGGKIFMVLSDQ